MTVFELHLQINQRLQDVASFKRNKYFPEEIDMALNKAMFRILEKGVEKKFQDSQINLTTVESLIQKNRASDVIIPQSNDPLYEPSILSAYSLVPTDLYWTLNNRLEVVNNPYDCETAPTVALTDLSEFVAVIGYPTVVGDTPFYQNLNIVSSLQGTLYAAPTELAGGVTTEPGKYFLTNNVIEQFYRTTNTGVYWERYRDTYYRGKFIVVSSSPLGTVTISCTGYPSTSVTATLTTYKTYNRGLIGLTPQNVVSIATPRIDKQDALYQAKYQNIYYAPKLNEPLINQLFDYFVLYRDKSFLITRLYTDYIRKPRTISLSLGQTCELNETTHPKLVDIAVEILRLDIKDPSYQATLQDTELRS